MFKGERKSVLIISYSPLHRDPRVLRQIDALKDDFIIACAGLEPPRLVARHAFYQLNKLYYINRAAFLLVRVYLKLRKILFLKLFFMPDFYYWDIPRYVDYAQFQDQCFDLIIANEIEALPLALKLAKKHESKIYHDAHEYTPLQYENDKHWLKWMSPYYTYLCKKHIPDADYCTTVGEEIAEAYEELTGKTFGVVYNAPDYIEPLPHITGNTIRFIHHGVAARIREVDKMIKVFKQLGNKYELNLMLISPYPNYYRELLAMAHGHSNIVFHDPVPVPQISNYISRFDVSLMIFPPVNFNYKHCLPNKFFESIQGRLMLMGGGSEPVKSFIEKHGIGRRIESLEVSHVAEVIQSITYEEIEKCKSRSAQIASEYTSERAGQIIRKHVLELCAE